VPVPPLTPLSQARVPEPRHPEDRTAHHVDWTREELQRAIEAHQFLLHYQPVVSLATGELEGVEGLLRWHHPQHGTLPAASFIDAMARHRLLGPLLPRLIDEACHTAVALADGNAGDPFVALNVDPHQFAEDPVVDLIETALATSGANAHSLVVEMTERHGAFDEEATMATARDLHDLGVQLAIDDFGTGHSTLTRLKALPAAKLKIDRSFVRDVVHDAEDQAIVASVVMLANGLGVGCVAEGVERADQAEVLSDLGCPTGQGFLLGEAVAPAQISTLAGSAVA
jgi:EAL domain-containing protein (putative c-di-GMP-specific phosphodiesterase class I)